MLNRYIIYVFFLAAVFLCLKCELDTKKYSPVPAIQFLSSEVKKESGVPGFNFDVATIEFYLIDGDGDFGLGDGDTLPPFIGDSVNNFFFTQYLVTDGLLVEDTSLKITAYKIPRIDIQGNDKTIKAKVYVDFEYDTKNNYDPPLDSLMYSFFVLDRALNKSNIEWTDTIILN